MIAGPVITILFQRGAFDAADATATAAALAAFALGLPAYVLVKALAPGFFAREDTATPVKIAAAALVLNVVAALALMPSFAHVGIALAAAISSWFNAGMLALLLYRRGLLDPDPRLLQRLVRIVVAAALMAAGLRLARAQQPGRGSGSGRARDGRGWALRGSGPIAACHVPSGDARDDAPGRDRRRCLTCSSCDAITRANSDTLYFTPCF